jgi:hypothetical protein
MANLLQRMPVPYEPKKKNRFIFRFPTRTGINEWQVLSTKRPQISINSNEIPFLNTKTFVSGQFYWESMDITFQDPIGPSTTQAVMEWVRLHAESVTGRMGYAAGYKLDPELEMLDPTGVVIEKWILQGTLVTSADFGQVSYEDDGLAQISVTMQPDRCILVF